MGGGVDISLPNVSYCEDVKDVHYTPYNLVRFYVGDIIGSQTAKIYTDETNHVDITVSEGNKWYTYVLPKDKGLYRIEGDSVKKVVVKADINFKATVHYPSSISIVSTSTAEASFKGSNTIGLTIMSNMFSYCDKLTSLDVSNFDTSKVTNMNYMFFNCSGLTSLDLSSFNTSNLTNMSEMFGGCSGLTKLNLSGWNMSKVTDMSYMFGGCTSLTSIRMVRCEQPTIDKIKAQLTKDNITGVTIVTK